MTSRRWPPSRPSYPPGKTGPPGGGWRFSRGGWPWFWFLLLVLVLWYVRTRGWF